ncbi:DUF2207 family protein [Aerococcaceae bacterium WGS1372]
MKKNRLRQIIVCILLVCGLFVPLMTYSTVYAQEVNFDIKDADIRGEISANGDVSFKEIYTFDVDFMNGAYHTIDYGGYNITDYRVGILDEETGEVQYLTESFNESAGTFKVSDNGTLFKLQVFNPAENETVHFVFEYTIEGLITNYNDTAELNRKIVPENTDDNFDVKAVIYLPGEVTNPDDFRVWAYGANNGEVYPKTESGQSYIDLTVVNNPPNQFVEVHSIFPTSLTPNNPNVEKTNVKDQIIAKAEAVVEADARNYAKEMRHRFYLIFGLLFLFPLMTIYASYYYFSKRKKLNPNPIHVPEHYYSLPEELTPAIMATAVFRSKPTADDFSATIIDLARKGYIQVEEVSRKKRGLLKRKSASTIRVSPTDKEIDFSDLQKHERYVYEYLLPNKETITLSEIEEGIENNRNFKKAKYRKWTQFSNYVEVKGEQIKGQPVEYGRSIMFAALAMSFSVALMIAIITLVIGTSLMEHLPWLIVILSINMLLAVVVFILTLARPIRTYEQDKRIKEWKAFANMLDDIGNFNMREVASLPLWEEFLVYAISLDVADKVVEAMNKEYGMEELSQMSMPTVMYTNPYWINQVVRPSISHSVSSSIPVGQSGGYSGSNTGGFGGGFSSGSSGGSGGGGGTGGF